MKFKYICCFVALLLLPGLSIGQNIKNFKDSTIVQSPFYCIVIDKKSGRISYFFQDSSFLKNTIAVIKKFDHVGYRSNDFARHNVSIQSFSDNIGSGRKISLVHEQPGQPVQLTQFISVYKGLPFFVLGFTASSKTGEILSADYMSPVTIDSPGSVSGFVHGVSPRLLDMPFDNDNWTKALTAQWRSEKVRGIGYSFTSLYDAYRLSGLVVGAVTHDFWKTGIQYTLSEKKGVLDSFVVYGGVSTPDNSLLAAEYGGNDGTHDIVRHGAMEGAVVTGPEIFMCGLNNRTEAFKAYGMVNAKKNGSLTWSKTAPFYWNSFGVESVLGYEKRVMPDGVCKISDDIASLKNFSANKKVYISIDSYDQGIYNGNVLRSIKEHCGRNNQELGFYFIPFAVWTWKTSVETDKLQYTDTYIKDVTLKGNDGKTIIYKEGDFGAFPLDPTHPATRQRIIGELEKAKTIGAKFLKIDFLTAGALESTTRFNKSIHSGLQAYNLGMKMLKGLIDSILGPDIFITQAISPTFPSQYTHIRFLSTDVYSHLRNDQKGFPNYGSTAASMITASHLGWMQGTLWPFTNMDVAVMKQFQKNNEISEQDVKVRLITMMVMGSALGDGSDFRDSITKLRAEKFLNNKNLCKYFERPVAFLPLKVADGLTEDQQLSFYLPGDTVHAAIINFNTDRPMSYIFSKENLQWTKGNYSIRDFFTDTELGTIQSTDSSFELTAAPADAVLVKLVKL